MAYTTPSYAVLHYSKILMCRLDRSVHSQVAKLTGCQYLLVKVKIAITITSQDNKMWLEWFPCFALLNLPFSTQTVASPEVFFLIISFGNSPHHPFFLCLTNGINSGILLGFSPHHFKHIRLFVYYMGIC